MENYNRVKKDDFGICYYLNDKLHRIDGPAEEFSDGKKYWYQNGLLHRIGGPAIEWANGEKHWYQNDLLHRIDGPACDYVDGYKEWWFEGKQLKCNSQEEFERIIKLKLFW
jgi:hypothetical protein